MVKEPNHEKLEYLFSAQTCPGILALKLIEDKSVTAISVMIFPEWNVIQKKLSLPKRILIKRSKVNILIKHSEREFL